MLATQRNNKLYFKTPSSTAQNVSSTSNFSKTDYEMDPYKAGRVASRAVGTGFNAVKQPQQQVQQSVQQPVQQVSAPIAPTIEKPYDPNAQYLPRTDLQKIPNQNQRPNYVGFIGYVNGSLVTFPTEQEALQSGATGIQPNYQYYTT